MIDAHYSITAFFLLLYARETHNGMHAFIILT
jgi:hypothetical protein